jgi:hypothetical protein
LPISTTYIESLFLPDHTHVPAVNREQPDVAGLMPEFRNGLDALAAVATTALQIGTAVLLATERDPIITAKRAARSCGQFHCDAAGDHQRRPQQLAGLARTPGRPPARGCTLAAVVPVTAGSAGRALTLTGYA